MPAGRVFAGSKVGVDGVVTISGTVDGTFGAGTQYVIGETAGGATREGIVFIGVNATTARAIALSATSAISYVDTINFIAAGTVSISGTSTVVFGSTQPISGTVTAIASGTQNVAIVGEPIDINFNKILGEDPLIGEGVSGSGVQRVTIANNGSGRLQLVGTVSTVGALLGTSNFIMVSGTVTTGTISLSGTSNVAVVGTPTVTIGTGTVSISGTSAVTLGGTPAVTAANVTIASITTGSVSIVGGPVFYVPGAAIASGTGLGGPLFIGIQSGATLGRGVLLTTAGGVMGTMLGTVTITAAGTMAVTAAGVTIASITPFQVGGGVVASGTGTGPLIMGIQIGATLSKPIQVTTTGAINIGQITTVLGMPVLSASGVTIANVTTGTLSSALIAGTTKAGSIFRTGHPTVWDAAVIATTSAAGGIIVKTSGAHTLYITDLLVNVAGPMSVTLCSETTAKMYLVGLATNGGAAMNLVNPLICTSAQSLRVVCGSSGSCSVFAVGYTVT